MSTSPHELGLPVKTNCQPGNCTGLGRTIHLNSHHFSTTEVASSITPMMCVQREPILRCINFQLSPTHNQVLWGYSRIGKVSHPNQHQFYQKSPSSLGHIHLQKSFNGMHLHSKVSNSFQIHIVPI